MWTCLRNECTDLWGMSTGNATLKEGGTISLRFLFVTHKTFHFQQHDPQRFIPDRFATRRGNTRGVGPDATQEGLVRAISWCKPELAEPLVGAVLPYSLSVSFRLIMPGHSAKMVSLNDVTRALTQHSISCEEEQRGRQTYVSDLCRTWTKEGLFLIICLIIEVIPWLTTVFALTPIQKNRIFNPSLIAEIENCGFTTR